MAENTLSAFAARKALRKHQPRNVARGQLPDDCFTRTTPCLDGSTVLDRWSIPQKKRSKKGPDVTETGSHKPLSRMTTRRHVLDSSVDCRKDREPQSHYSDNGGHWGQETRTLSELDVIRQNGARGPCSRYTRARVPNANLLETDAELEPESRDILASPTTISLDDYQNCYHALLTLDNGKALTMIGHYDLWVRKGSVSILGAILHASSNLFRVYSPCTEALPQIRHVQSPFGPSNQPAEFLIRSCFSGIRPLRRCSPRFDRIWNSQGVSQYQSFSLLRNTVQRGKQRPATTLRLARDWTTLIISISASEDQGPPVVMVCGPKGTGKSTFSRLLLNSFLTGISSRSGVGFLDLDPGQPEYSPPGEVSLLHLKKYNLGPPFTHPMVLDESGDSLVRSHHTGALSPRDNVIHYLDCAKDLLDHYDDLYKNGCPLIINCSGWTQGTGMNALEAILQRSVVNNVVFMGDTGPEPLGEVLQRCAEATGAAFHKLSIQPSALSPIPAAERRMMQTLSYFHLDPLEHTKSRWDQTPLYLKEPISMSYAGLDHDILGIMILGEQINPDMLVDVINGSVLALVAIEDTSCLPYYAFYSETTWTPAEQIDPEMNNEDTTDEIHCSPSSRACTDETVRGDMAKVSNDKPLLTKGGIPYLFNGIGTNTPLDPSKTRSIGQVLVRAIDGRNKKLQVLTPLSKDMIQSFRTRGMPLVLVKGKLDTPGWSYQEEYFTAFATHSDKEKWTRCKRELRCTGESESEEDEKAGSNMGTWTARNPWIETVESNVSSRKNDRVWKVRRNLKTRNGKIK